MCAGVQDVRLGEPNGGLVAGDPALLALLVEYGRYLLLASSRPDGPPATLQGIWNAELRPPWSSNYTLNINLPGSGIFSADRASLEAFARQLGPVITDLQRKGAL